MNLARAVDWLARSLAVLGGVTLGAITLLTVVSVVGRSMIWAGLGPIAGDYEMAEALTGVAIFCFLPICQLNRGHVVVDLFEKQMGPTLTRWIDALSEIVMAVVLIIIAWRLTAGFADKYHNGETSFIRQFPMWWAYGASLLPAYAAVVTGLYTSWRGVKAVALGRDLLPEHLEIE
jgi:TRAP-type C4-dicarboxylate transport system permease small subunit